MNDFSFMRMHINIIIIEIYNRYNGEFPNKYDSILILSGYTKFDLNNC